MDRHRSIGSASPPDNVLVRGTGDGGVLTDDSIVTYFNAQIDPAATEPDVQQSNGGAGEGIIFDALTFARRRRILILATRSVAARWPNRRFRLSTWATHPS